MQLKLQRSQRAGGLSGSTVFFCLDVRADYTAEEKANISKYRLGGQAIYNSRAAQKHLDAADIHLDRTQEGSTGNRFAGLARGAVSLALAKMQLNVTIASLGKGHHIECKDMAELLESEDTIRNACKDLTRYLEAAATFDGSETVVEYVNGEERVHVAQHAPPLLEYQPEAAEAEPAVNFEHAALSVPSPIEEMGRDFARLAAMFRTRWLEFERRVLEFCAANGMKVGETPFRAVCGIAGLILFIAILQIL